MSLEMELFEAGMKENIFIARSKRLNAMLLAKVVSGEDGPRAIVLMKDEKFDSIGFGEGIELRQELDAMADEVLSGGSR